MQSAAVTPEEYLENLSEDRKPIVTTIRNTILQNIPEGFIEIMNYGMLGYVVPHTLYPSGYHCDPKQPLPFIGLASQKAHISFYHMGLYADSELTTWFQDEWTKISKKKLDMGKSCVRFKKAEDVPIDLLAALVRQLTPQAWIALYETNFKKNK
jgi:hypothetical protein